jgi:hypothetical protein
MTQQDGGSWQTQGRHSAPLFALQTTVIPRGHMGNWTLAIVHAPELPEPIIATNTAKTPTFRANLLDG